MGHRRPRRSGLSPNGEAAFRTLPRQQAETLVRGALARAQETKDEYYSEFEGQQTGVPGMGPAPELRHEPAKGVFTKFLHPGFTIFEQLRRALPEEGWFDSSINPQNPFQFQLGAFTVPPGVALWLFDYEFTIYRPSGVDPGDFVRAENGRFSNQIGFDITVSRKRDANISFQLDPQPVSVSRQEFERAVPEVSGRRGAQQPTSAFDRAGANSFASTAGAGTSLLPARPNRFGPRDGPWTLIADEGAKVALNVVIFNRVRAPISTIEGRQAGYLLNRQVTSSLINRVRPR